MKNTNNLKEDLMETTDFDRFLKDNEENFNNENVSELIYDLFKKKKMSKASLAKSAGMSEVYLHQIFAGNRKPSRDRLICLCIGLKATLEKTQELLKHCGFAKLYPRDRRDAIIFYGVVNNIDLFKINDKLFTEGEATLC